MCRVQTAGSNVDQESEQHGRVKNFCTALPFLTLACSVPLVMKLSCSSSQISSLQMGVRISTQSKDM